MTGVKVKGSKLTVKLTKPTGLPGSDRPMPFFAAIPTKPADRPEGVRTPTRLAGPYYIMSRDDRPRSVVAERNNALQGQRARRTPTGSSITVQHRPGRRACCRSRRSQVDYDLGGVPPTARSCTICSKQFGVNKGRYFVNPLTRSRVPRAEHDRPTVQATCKLPRRPSTTRSTARRCSRQRGGSAASDRPDPAAGHARLQARRRPVPDQGPNVREGQGARRRQQVGNVVFYAHHDRTGLDASRRSSSSTCEQIGLNVEPKPFPSASRSTTAGHGASRFDAVLDRLDCRTTPIRTTSSTSCWTARTSRTTNNNNYAYFNNAAYNKLMEAAARARPARPLRRRTATSTSTS